ncbi:protein kinase [Streptomyces sp. TRM66268-LWL]|uniref:Protein kinase n=1 Tax=Streptomyces polyasparticus TaxID=2767826 RepID=A0ABR7SM19_9ACTN|nr:serine/threonine-protein kinase [Streptomyces polyasparticus]MBC9715949.1 protein kinase [Streptomyces polyasparticus]
MTAPLLTEDPRELGRHRLVGRLGAGGMGQVYLARSPGGRHVALKTVHAHLAADPHYRERFRREATAARKVTGTYTAPVLDADPDAELPWLATAFLPGVTLRQAVAATGPLLAPAVRALTAALAEALRDIHAARLVHRDLKPSNILVTREGPRVVDFGIARAEHDAALTETGGMIGTPGYMSPEQIVDGRSVTAATDVFALGAVLTFAATGEGAFRADTVPALLYQIVNEEPDLSGVPEDLRELIGRCLAKSPQQRPTPDELLRSTAAAQPATWWRDEPVHSLVTDAEGAVRALPEPEPATKPMPQAPQPPSWRRELTRRGLLTAGGAGLIGLFGYALAHSPADADGGTGEAWKVTRGAGGPGGIRWQLGTESGHVDALLATPLGIVLHGAEDVPSSTGVVQLRTAATGKRRWSAESGSDVPADWGVTGDGILLAGGLGLTPTTVATGKSLPKPTAPDPAQKWYVPAGTVMVICEERLLRAVSLTSGAELWRRDQYTDRRRPAVAGGRLLLPHDYNEPACVDAKSGEVLWTYKELGDGASVAAVGTLPADRYTVLTTAGTLHIIDAATGHRLASRTLDAEIAHGATALASVGPAGLLLTGTTVHGFTADDARLRWSSPTIGLDASWTRLPGGAAAPVVAGGLLLNWRDDRTLTALDPRTGRILGRPQEFDGTSPAQCPPAVAPGQDTVYAAAGRTCTAFRATGTGLTRVAGRTAPAQVTALAADALGWYACAGRKTVLAVNAS